MTCQCDSPTTSTDGTQVALSPDPSKHPCDCGCDRCDTVTSDEDDAAAQKEGRARKGSAE